MMYEIIVGDCIETLRAMEDETVDLVVTDPAYESLEKHRAKGTTTRLKQSKGSSNAWFETFPNSRFPELMRELYRVMKPNSHLYVMADEETTFDVVKPTGVAAGFTWWKVVVWVKTLGVAPDPEESIDHQLDRGIAIGMGYHWRNSHEFVGFLEKGKRRLNELGWPSVIAAPRVRGYPTEKPVSLATRLIENSSRVGDVVLDVFAGSGSTGEAALRVGRKFIGVEVDQNAAMAASGRLSEFGERRAVATRRSQMDLLDGVSHRADTEGMK